MSRKFTVTEINLMLSVAHRRASRPPAEMTEAERLFRVQMSAQSGEIPEDVQRQATAEEFRNQSFSSEEPAP